MIEFFFWVIKKEFFLLEVSGLDFINLKFKKYILNLDTPKTH